MIHILMKNPYFVSLNAQPRQQPSLVNDTDHLVSLVSSAGPVLLVSLIGHENGDVDTTQVGLLRHQLLVQKSEISDFLSSAAPLR